MEQGPKISIIVPVYNVAPYLRQCLDSLVGQTYRDIEIICVDDGSTDESGEILDQYAADDPRIRVIHIGNSGVSAARNLALDRVSGDYVIFVDGDDWIETSTCETVLAMASRYDLVMWPYVREYPDHSEPKEIFPDTRSFDKTGCRALHRRMIGLWGGELSHPENADALSTVWGKLYRRTIIEQHHLRFTDLKQIGTYEDGLFDLRYFAHISSAAYIPAYLNHYRKGSGMTSRYRERLSAQWRTLFSLMQTYIRENDLGQDFSEALQNRISLSIIGLGLNAMALPSRDALQEIRGILSDPGYRAAVKTLPMRYFPPHWWVFFACCKLNFAEGVFLLLKAMERMKG